MRAVVVGYLVAMDIADSFVWHQVGRPCAKRPSDAANTIRHAKACSLINPMDVGMQCSSEGNVNMRVCVCFIFVWCKHVDDI